MLFDDKRGSESVAAASVVTIGSKLVNAALQLVVSMVLARLLTPAEYGVVAVLTVFTGFFSIVADAGISSAIIQFRDLTDEDYSLLFFFSLLMGLALAITFMVLSYAISVVYNDRIYIPLGGILTLSVMANSLNMVPNGLLLKEKRFVTVGARLIVCNALVSCVTIALALLGFGCYAIALQSVFSSAAILIWNLLSTGVRMSFGDFRPTIRRVGSYSAFQFGHQAIGWLAGNIDTLLTGKLFGPDALGYYNKAFSLYGYPNSMLVVSITSTLRPFLSEYQDDMDAMYAHFVRIVKRLSLVSALMTVEMSLCAYELIEILFGKTWMPSAPLLATLSLAIYSRAINSAHAPLMGASNRTDLLMFSTGVNTAITCAMIVVGGSLGTVQYLATCVTIAYNLELVLPVYLSMRRCVGHSICDYVRNFVPEVGAAVGAYALVALMPTPFTNACASLVVKAFCTFVVYVGLCVLFGQRRELASMCTYFGRFCPSRLRRGRSGE